MFDIGFSEMLVLAVVALVVLGPERLPKVARQAGHWMGTLRRYVEDVKADLNRHVQASELQALQSHMTDAAREFHAEMQSLTASNSTASPAATTAPDWEKVYAVRRQREKLLERRIERDKALGRRRPRRSSLR